MWPKKQANKPLLKPAMFCRTLCRGQNLGILPCPFSHCLQNVWQTPRQNYRSKRCHLGNVLKSATLLSATTECHSQNWERRRSATPFYQKERCGGGTHIFALLKKNECHSHFAPFDKKEWHSSFAPYFGSGAQEWRSKECRSLTHCRRTYSLCMIIPCDRKAVSCDR